MENKEKYAKPTSTRISRVRTQKVYWKDFVSWSEIMIIKEPGMKQMATRMNLKMLDTVV